jgi:hypothetical protein
VDARVSGIGLPAITPAIFIIRSTTARSSFSIFARQYTTRYEGGHCSSSTQSDTTPSRSTAFALARAPIVETSRSSPSVT